MSLLKKENGGYYKNLYEVQFMKSKMWLNFQMLLLAAL